ncbi:DUF930 domain-containing protein [Rhizobium sp. KVB221]|uniref:DUF930 domain-containing protein n=1 Tax=Rhizobium setariae TaxID=2801340 RepID=A0A937CMZ3_9HYPH|nr:DUF930 domain-containing protein [Rhizobium setariae]MBL0370553.1 DUF930 domain-containing protein [Rhizobium setariae]
MATLPSHSFAVDGKLKAQLLKLDPKTRLEQACDTEAMFRIKADDNPYQPDKVIAYTFKDPVYGKDWIEAPGAVFRSHGDWYRLSFKCHTGPQNLDVVALDYKIGEKISRESWGEYYLYD